MPGIIRTQFRKFLHSNPVGRRLKRVLDSEVAKAGISYVFIVPLGIIGIVFAKKSVDRNRVEIMRGKRRIREAEKKYAEEFYREKRKTEGGNKDSS